MNTEIKKVAPKWFWIVSVIALIWYLMDTTAFFMRTIGLENMLAGMPEQQRSLYLSMPLWVNVVFAAEAFGGLLGSVGLLLKKSWALVLYTISIAGVIAQTTYVYFMSDSIKIMGTAAIVMPLMAILIGAGMIILTRLAEAKHWVR